LDGAGSAVRVGGSIPGHCHFKVIPNDEHRRKGTSQFASESVEWTNLSVLQETFHFLDRQALACDGFPDLEVASGSRTFEPFEGLADFAAALGAWSLNRDFGFKRLVVVSFRVIHDFGGELLDLGHEVFPAELSLLHSVEFGFPFTGELGGAEFGDGNGFEHLDQRDALGCGC
jgi:hypothetical protein